MKTLNGTPKRQRVPFCPAKLSTNKNKFTRQHPIQFDF
jgi:hypothetical protein